MEGICPKRSLFKEKVDGKLLLNEKYGQMQGRRQMCCKNMAEHHTERASSDKDSERSFSMILYYSPTQAAMPSLAVYSTVTHLARFLGWSTSQPRRVAIA